jgi:release factor glutamine methyltransferase
LARAGLSDVSVDARVLAGFVLGWDAARLLTHDDDAEPAGFAERYEALVERRARSEPVAYITGEKEFWNLSFEVSPAVLIPRPETETIVEVALARFPYAAPFAAADVGTGSGCLAVALAKERPLAAVTATDISDDALQIARRNAVRHGVASKIRFIETDVLEGVEGRFDLIMANPPYVPESDRDTLQPDVRDYEPPLALFAGADGLTIIRRLLAQAASRLAAGGTLMFEFGFGQADAVTSLIANAPGLTMIDLKRDLQDIPRVAVAVRKP